MAFAIKFKIPSAHCGVKTQTFMLYKKFKLTKIIQNYLMNMSASPFTSTSTFTLSHFPLHLTVYKSSSLYFWLGTVLMITKRKCKYMKILNDKNITDNPLIQHKCSALLRRPKVKDTRISCETKCFHIHQANRELNEIDIVELGKRLVVIVYPFRY